MTQYHYLGGQISLENVPREHERSESAKYIPHLAKWSFDRVDNGHGEKNLFSCFVVGVPSTTGDDQEYNKKGWKPSENDLLWTKVDEDDWRTYMWRFENIEHDD
jgi:hypothetical protein